MSVKTTKFKSKREYASEEGKSKYDEALKDLESKKSDLERRYADLKNASEDIWKEIKDAFSSASTCLRTACQKFLLYFLILNQTRLSRHFKALFLSFIKAYGKIYTCIHNNNNTFHLLEKSSSTSVTY